MNADISNQENINIKRFLQPLAARWYYFVLSFLFFTALAFAFIKTADPVYRIKCTIIVKEKSKNQNPDNFLGNMADFHFLRNIDNEIGTIRSFHLIHKTLSELHYEVSYFRKQWWKNKEEYHAPFIIQADTSAPQLLNTPIHIRKIADKSYLVEVNASKARVHHINSDAGNWIYEGEVNTRDTVKAGEPFSNRYFSFTILDNPAYTDPDSAEAWHITINNLFRLSNEYLERLEMKTSTVESSIIEVSLKGKVIEKEKKFLNQLCQNDIYWGLHEKNEIAANTIGFIDDQLKKFADSLNRTEDKLEKFRVTDKVMDIDFQARNSYELLRQLEEEHVGLKVKHKYYTYLQEYISSNSALDKLVAPSTIGINDPLLNDLISEINSLNSEKAALSYGVKSKSPAFNAIDLKIENSKKTLTENIRNILKSSEISLKENEQRISQTSALLNKLPRTERELLNIQRKFNHNDLMFNFLMEKRAAASIALASNVADSKILDAATLDKNDPVFPNIPLTLALAMVLALVFPATAIILTDLIRDRVTTKEDVTGPYGLKFLGVVPHMKDPFKNTMLRNDLSAREHINMIRSNIYHIAGSKNKIIGVTSHSEKEGKSLVSLLLADAFTRTGKKVLLLETNLRSPSVARKLELNTSLTLNNYLENDLLPEKIIHASYKNGFDVIIASDCDGRQDEYFHSSRFSDLMNYIREKYDVVIIDSTCTGKYSDYYSISSFIDLHLFVVRNNHTQKSDVHKLQSMKEGMSLHSCAIVLNDFHNR